MQNSLVVAKRKKRDALRTDRSSKSSQDGPQPLSAEDDAIDAAIQYSIVKFGA